MKSIRFFALLFGSTISLASCSSTTAPAGNPTTASGTVTLTVKINDSRTANTGTNETKTRKETVLASLVFNLPSDSIVTSASDRSSAWSEAEYGGTVNWIEEDHRTYLCGTGSTVTDVDTTTQTFSSATSGLQPSNGVSLVMKNGGTYTLTLAPSSTGTPTQLTHTTWSYCPSVSHSTTGGALAGLPPFAKYFTPTILGVPQALTGTINSNSPNQVKGTYHGIDSMVVLSPSTGNVSVPVDVTVDWDINLK